MPSMAMLPIVVALLVQQPAPSAASLDFEFFKTRIQPIFTAKRPAHARCVSCHSTGTPMGIDRGAPLMMRWGPVGSGAGATTGCSILTSGSSSTPSRGTSS